MSYVAILGINKTTLHLAALFANTGRKVFLFERTRAEAQIAKESIFYMNPMPLLSHEAANYINCCGLDCDLDEFANLDLIVEGLDKSLDDRKAFLSSLMFNFRKDAKILSLYQGESVAELADSLNSWFRPHFVGVHFFFNPKFNRLVELIPTPKTEKKTIADLQFFLNEKLGRFTVIVKDKPNLIADRIAIFFTCAAIYRAKSLNLDIETMEALTKLVFAHTGGVLFFNQYIGNDKVVKIYNNIDPAEKERFKEIFNSFEYDFLQNKIFYDYFQGKFIFNLKETYLPPILTQNFNAKKWAFFKKNQNPLAKFIYYFLIDIWQYLAYICQQENLKPEFLEDILENAYGFNQKFYKLLQEFEAKSVYNSTLEEQKLNKIPYPISDIWKRKQSLKNEHLQKLDILLSEAELKSECIFHSQYLYKDKLLIFKPKDDIVYMDTEIVNCLLNAVKLAKLNNYGLMIYLNGVSFYGIKDFKDLREAERTKRFNKITDLLVALRMLDTPYIFAIKGKVIDSAMALMMQADQIIADLNFSWHLTNPAERLPPFGGICFEWLRRIPRFSKGVSLQYMHSVISFLLNPNAQGRAYNAKELGIFRSSDYLVMNSDNFPEYCKKTADLWLSGNFFHPPRYPVSKLAESDLDFFIEKSKNLTNPEVYLDCIQLFMRKEQTNIISLRKLLKAELSLINKYLSWKELSKISPL